jgi:hypothetical protein
MASNSTNINKTNNHISHITFVLKIQILTKSLQICPFPVDISTITGWIPGVKSLFRPPISPTMTNIYINFVILLKPGPGAIKHENFLKYEKILNCHGNVEMPTYNWPRMKISINLTMHIVRLK